MSWLDDYRQASFRGVEFYVPTYEGSGGRRLQVTEFPGQDLPYVEDFGKKASRQNLEAYVIGDDYHLQRNRLILALETKGKGLLVHPYLGDIYIMIDSFTWRDTLQEMGMARFTIGFVEAGELRFPTTVVDTKGAVALAKEASEEAVSVDFIDRFSIVTNGISVVNATKDAIETGFELMETAKQTVANAPSYRRALENARARSLALMYDALELIENVKDLIGFGTNADDDVEATEDNAHGSYEDMKAMYTYSPKTVTEDADDPTIVFQESFNRLALINQAGLLSFIEYTSLDEAVVLRDEVFTGIDKVLEETKSDDVYNTFYNLRTVVAQDIDERARKLPRLVNKILNVSECALILSYELYGNIDREQEIIDRNRVVHPAFVPGGVELEVLIDV